MIDSLLHPADAPAGAVPVHPIAAPDLDAALERLGGRAARHLKALGFEAESGRIAIIPDVEGGIEAVAFGLGQPAAEGEGPLLFGKLATGLPDGTYRLAAPVAAPDLAAIAFALAGYRYQRYRSVKARTIRLVLPEGADPDRVSAVVDGVVLARDLINTPANDMAPADLAAEVRSLGERNGARVTVVEGDELRRGYPLVWAVGESSDRAPALVDFTWGDDSHPKVTLVGKGVVFDTGGLDIKPPSSMAMMKKDMGGAANVLGLAAMIMRRGLKVRLRVIVPCVENAISGRAFRPGDVFRSRKGMTVEIGNTDAEGRLILADGLALADEEKPDLIVTMSTLTGAARAALGPDLPPFYTNDDAFAADLAEASAAVSDPMWRMPLWKPYDSWLSSKVADVNHISKNAFAGSIVAALFLRRFVTEASIFSHFDIYGWSPNGSSLGPEGGEAQAIRALFHHLERRFG